MLSIHQRWPVFLFRQLVRDAAIVWLPKMLAEWHQKSLTISRNLTLQIDRQFSTRKWLLLLLLLLLLLAGRDVSKKSLQNHTFLMVGA